MNDVYRIFQCPGFALFKSFSVVVLSGFQCFNSFALITFQQVDMRKCLIILTVQQIQMILANSGLFLRYQRDYFRCLVEIPNSFRSIVILLVSESKSQI